MPMMPKLRNLMESRQDGFVNQVADMTGLEKEQVEAAIEKLSVDEISNLVDASNIGEVDAVKQIIGDTRVEADEGREAEDSSQGDTDHEEEDDETSQGDKKKPTKTRKVSSFSVGDEVVVDGHSGTVKQPKAPGGTIGVMINGKLRMIDKTTQDIKIKESETGMDSLNRIKELAGMADDTYSDVDTKAPEIDFGGEEYDNAGLGADLGSEMEITPVASFVPASPVGDQDVPAYPVSSEVPSVYDATAGLTDAMALDTAISEIEQLIPNTKLSEYKTLISRLEGLVAMAKATGKAALTESTSFSIDDDIEDFADADDFLMDDGEDVVDSFSKMVGEGKLKIKSEDALDIDGDNKTEVKNTKKTLLDYVKEAEEEVEIGSSTSDAVKSLQTRMGPKATPQEARRVFDAMSKSQDIRQSAGRFTMKSMGDDDFNAAISAHTDQKSPTTKVAPKPQAPNKPASSTTNGFNQSSSKSSSSAGGGNGYQGQ